MKKSLSPADGQTVVAFTTLEEEVLIYIYCYSHPITKNRVRVTSNEANHFIPDISMPCWKRAYASSLEFHSNQTPERKREVPMNFQQDMSMSGVGAEYIEGANPS